MARGVLMEFNEMVETIKAGEQLSIPAKEYPALRRQLCNYAAFIRESDTDLFLAVVEELQRLDLEYKTGKYKEDKWLDCVYTDKYFSIMILPGGLFGLAIKKIFVTIHFLPFEWEALRIAMKELEASRKEALKTDQVGMVKLEIPRRRFVVDLMRDEYFAFLNLMDTCSLEYIQEKYLDILKTKFDRTNPIQMV